MHTPQGTARGGDVRRRLRELAFTAADLVDDARDRRGPDRPRAAGARAGLGADGDAADLGGPAILGARDDRAAKNLARLVEAWRLLDGELGLVLAGGRGLGRPAGPRRSADPAARLRPGRGDRAALPWRRGARLPVPVRGLRHADRRGDGVRDARGRLVASVARRGVRRCGRARRPARPGGDRRRDPRGGRAARRARPPRPRARGAVLVGETGAAMLAALEERA